MSEPASSAPRRSTALRILIGIGIFAAAVGIMSFALRTLVDTLASQRSREIVEGRLSAALGLEVRILGDFQLEVLPTPRFRVHELVVSNPPGEPTQYLLRVERVDLSFDLVDLLFGELHISDLDLYHSEIHYDGALEGLTSASHVDTLSDEQTDGVLPFEIRSLEIEDLRIVYGEGGEAGLWSVHLARLEIDSERFDSPIRLRMRGELQGSAFDLEGELGSMAELFHPTRPFPVRAAGRVFEGEVEVDGQIENPIALQGIDLGVRASLRDIGALYSVPGRKLPPIGPIAVRGRLVDPGQILGVNDLVVEISDPSLRGSVRGAIADIVEARGVHLELSLTLHDLSLVEALVDRSLPNLTPFVLSATLSDRDGSIGVDAHARAGRPGADLRLEFRGSHGDLRQIDSVDVGFELEARDLAVLGKELALDESLPPIGPVRLKGRLRGDHAELGVKGLEIEIGAKDKIWVKGGGTIGNLVDLAHTDVSIDFGIEHLGDLGALLGGDPPDVGPIRGGATLTDRDGSLGIENFHAEGGRAGLFWLQVLGSFDDFRDLDEITVDARLDARDLAVAGEVLGLDLPALGPVAFHGTIKGSREKILSQGEARIDQTRFEGTWSGSFPEGSRPRIELDVRSPNVRLRDIGIEPSDEQLLVALPPATFREAARGWWTGSEDLPFDLLRRVDGRATLALALVTGRSEFRLSDVSARVDLEDGDLVVQKLELTYEGGAIEGTLRVDARTPDPHLSVVGTVSGAHLDVLMSQFVADTRSSGIVDGSIDVRSQGRSMDEVRSNLNGRMQVRFRDWAVASLYMDRVIKDLVRAFLSSEKGKLETLDCLAADLDISDGIATVRSLVLETADATVRGEGTINLGAEKFDLTLEPEVHDPSLLSVAAKVYVTGPLAAPDFRSSKLSLATSATRGLLVNVLRPGRVLFDVIRGKSRRGKSPETVCEPAAGPGSPAGS